MDINTLVHDDTWLFVLGILGVAGFILTIFSLFLRKKKSLSRQIISLEKIFNVNKEFADKINILYEGVAVSNVYFSKIIFINTGNVPIIIEDYEQNIFMDFGPESQIFSVEISNQSPQNLDAKFRIAKTGIELLPCLLNEKDSITLKILFNNKTGRYDITSRIRGVRKLSQYYEEVNFVRNTWITGLTLFLIFFALIKIIHRAPQESPSTLLIIIGIIGLFLFLFGFAFWIFYHTLKIVPASIRKYFIKF